MNLINAFIFIFIFSYHFRLPLSPKILVVLFSLYNINQIRACFVVCDKHESDM